MRDNRPSELLRSSYDPGSLSGQRSWLRSTESLEVIFRTIADPLEAATMLDRLYLLKKVLLNRIRELHQTVRLDNNSPNVGDSEPEVAINATSTVRPPVLATSTRRNLTSMPRAPASRRRDLTSSTTPIAHPMGRTPIGRVGTLSTSDQDDAINFALRCVDPREQSVWLDGNLWKVLIHGGDQINPDWLRRIAQRDFPECRFLAAEYRYKPTESVLHCWFDPDADFDAIEGLMRVVTEWFHPRDTIALRPNTYGIRSTRPPKRATTREAEQRQRPLPQPKRGAFMSVPATDIRPSDRSHSKPSTTPSTSISGWTPEEGLPAKAVSKSAQKSVELGQEHKASKSLTSSRSYLEESGISTLDEGPALRAVAQPKKKSRTKTLTKKHSDERSHPIEASSTSNIVTRSRALDTTIRGTSIITPFEASLGLVQPIMFVGPDIIRHTYGTIWEWIGHAGLSEILQIQYYSIPELRFEIFVPIETTDDCMKRTISQFLKYMRATGFTLRLPIMLPTFDPTEVVTDEEGMLRDILTEDAKDDDDVRTAAQRRRAEKRELAAATAESIVTAAEEALKSTHRRYIIHASDGEDDADHSAVTEPQSLVTSPTTPHVEVVKRVRRHYTKRANNPRTASSSKLRQQAESVEDAGKVEPSAQPCITQYYGKAVTSSQEEVVTSDHDIRTPGTPAELPEIGHDQSAT